jgi:hypothetical protein
MSDTLSNFLVDTIKEFDEITDSFTELVDLGKAFTYRHLLISNTLDKDVVIDFVNTPNVELIIPAGSPSFDMVMDDFRHFDLIQIKYVSDAPTIGQIKFVSWRGE